MGDETPNGMITGPHTPTRTRGRGEDWVAGELTRRGHLVIQQHPVWRGETVGQYWIDLTVGRVAVEVEMMGTHPWLDTAKMGRAAELVRDKWKVFYLWVGRGKDAKPTEEGIDAILRFSLDTAAGSKHSFRACDGNGKLLQVGWLNSVDELVFGDPADSGEWPVEDTWSPIPPKPPAHEPLYSHSESPDYEPVRKLLRPRGPLSPEAEAAWEARKAENEEKGAKALASENAKRKEWWDYYQAFNKWDAERKRRAKPWEKLPSVERARGPFWFEV